MASEYRYFSVVAPPAPLSIDAPHTELYFADQFGAKKQFLKEWVMPGYDENAEDEDRKMKYTLLSDSLGKPDLKLWTPPKIHHYSYGYKSKPGSQKNTKWYFVLFRFCERSTAFAYY